MRSATDKYQTDISHWLNNNFEPTSGTDYLHVLDQAFTLLEKEQKQNQKDGCKPLAEAKQGKGETACNQNAIVFITDGAPDMGGCYVDYTDGRGPNNYNTEPKCDHGANVYGTYYMDACLYGERGACEPLSYKNALNKYKDVFKQDIVANATSPTFKAFGTNDKLPAPPVKGQEIMFVAFGMGDDANRDLLGEMANFWSGGYQQVSDKADTNQLKTYLATVFPPNPKQGK